MLAWQSYETLGHTAQDDRVVLRMRWTGELAIDVGAWDKGTQLRAWSVAHYRVRQGLITEIEQHDCYEAP